MSCDKPTHRFNPSKPMISPRDLNSSVPIVPSISLYSISSPSSLQFPGPSQLRVPTLHNTTTTTTTTPPRPSQGIMGLRRLGGGGDGLRIPRPISRQFDETRRKTTIEISSVSPNMADTPNSGNLNGNQAHQIHL